MNATVAFHSDIPQWHSTVAFVVG